MRVLTFQTKEVLNIILNKGIYKPDSNYYRERRDYKLDMEHLNGENPIWCFAPITGKEFEYYDFVSGELLEKFRCEMSLDQEIGLTKFALLEIEVPEDSLFTGKTHNSYLGAKVFSTIIKEQLKAVYNVVNTTHWYYKNIILVKSYDGDNILFPSGLRTLKRITRNGCTYEIYTEGMVAKHKVQHYAFVDGIIIPVIIKEVSYNGDFYSVQLEDGTLKEVESLFVKISGEIENMKLF